MAAANQEASGLLKGINELPGVRGSALVTRDGLPYEIQIPGSLNQEVFAAMSATIQGAAETAFFELGADDAKKIVITSDKATLLLTGAGKELLLLVVCTSDEHLDEVWRHAKNLVPPGQNLS